MRRQLEDGDARVEGELADLVRRQTRRRSAPSSLASCTTPWCATTTAVRRSWSDARTSTVPSAFLVRSSTEPEVMKRPRPITMISSALTAISLIRCELTKTVRPSLARDRKNSRIHWMPSGSSPLTGSSKSRMPGSPSRAAAMPSRWLMPSEIRADLLVGDGADADELEHLVDARLLDLIRRGERAKVVARGASGMDGLGVEERTDLAKRILQVRVARAVNRGASLGGVVEAEDDPHGGGLARSVGPEEARDDAGFDFEVQVINRERVAVALGEVVDFDHGMPEKLYMTSLVRRRAGVKKAIKFSDRDR